LTQFADDVECLEIVSRVPVEGHHLLEHSRGRRVMLVTGPDEVAQIGLPRDGESEAKL
jgi:hypothetical protein